MTLSAVDGRVLLLVLIAAVLFFVWALLRDGAKREQRSRKQYQLFLERALTDDNTGQDKHVRLEDYEDHPRDRFRWDRW